MNYLIHPDDWHRQCVQLGDEFWVIPVGAFGTTIAGDLAENSMAFVTEIFHYVYHMPGVDVFVDNFENVTPSLLGGSFDVPRAKHEWHTLVSVCIRLGIPHHEMVAPTHFWGCVRDDLEIDSHLGWGGCSSPRPMAWVPIKKRARLIQSVDRWAAQTKYSCTDLAAIAGFLYSLEAILKCLSHFLSSIISFLTRCEHAVAAHPKFQRSWRLWAHKRLGSILHALVGYLEKRSWQVPIVDWNRSNSLTLTLVADAACPKALGLAYTSEVWGKGAYCSVDSKTRLRKNLYFISTKHSILTVSLAKRSAALSSPFLELENYVTAIISFVTLSGAFHVILFGDCQIALDWITVCFPQDKYAAFLLGILLDAQLELGFTVATVHLPRTEPRVVRADKLSRGDSHTSQVMQADGYARTLPAPLPRWPHGYVN
jgi:hypothetical protein